MMDKVMEEHFKSLLWVIKYVLDTKDKVLGLCSKKVGRDLKWWLLPNGDSNWVEDENQRLNITSWVIYLMGTPISWKSRAQKNVTLSSMEAEYVSLLELVAEIMFIKQVLEFLRLKVKYPIHVILIMLEQSSLQMIKQLVRGPSTSTSTTTMSGSTLKIGSSKLCL